LKKILKDIFKILGSREKEKLWKLAIADIVISFLDIIFLIALLWLIDFYTGPGQTTLPKIISGHSFIKYPFLPIGLFSLLFLVKNIFGFLVSRAQYEFVYKVASRISRDGLLQYLHGSYADYIHMDSSVIHRKINQQPIEFSHYVLNGIQQVFSQAILILVTLLAIFFYKPVLLPLLVLFLAPPVLLISFYMKRRMHRSRQLGQKTSEKSIQHLQEALAGFVESNTYGKSDFFTSRYHRYQSELNRYLAERLSIQGMPPRFMEIFAVFGLFLLVVFSYMTSHNSTVPLVTIGALMIAAYKIIPGIVKITNAVGQVKTYSYSTTGLAKQSPEPRPFENKNESVSLVVFEDIDFLYENKSILESFSLTLHKGELVGMTGPSGKGKSTLINLLLGFLEPSSGEIYINGTKTSAEGRMGFWNRISYVKQQHFFLHASLRENITLQDERGDSKKLEDILNITGIGAILKELPQGLNTVVTENGKNFSGGQRQRIILARALYRDFDLLILDEPFSELDEHSELEMIGLLQKLAAAGKTIFLVTHSSRALSFCNRKIILDEPR
jgi:ABC-type multidrug transport system fused ATPase/permease subunit